MSKKYYLCDCCQDTDNPNDEAIYNCRKCGKQICNVCVINLKEGEKIPCDYQRNIYPKYCPFCGSAKSYTTYTEVTKEVLGSLKVGDLVKVNDWKKPMRVKGVSENYAVMIQKQFKDTYYSVIEKKARTAGQHNAMRQGFSHCGKDDWIFGDSEFEYNFDDAEAVARYLNNFESNKNHLSERTAIPILEIHIKSNSK